MDRDRTTPRIPMGDTIAIVIVIGMEDTVPDRCMLTAATSIAVDLDQDLDQEGEEDATVQDDGSARGRGIATVVALALDTTAVDP